MRVERRFDPAEVVYHALGLPAAAGPTWAGHGTTYVLPGGLIFSSVSICPDEHCPDGLFDTGSAVDVDATRAEERACLECVERYALAARGWHAHTFVSDVAPTHAWAGAFASPYGYSRDHGPCAIGLDGQRLSVGDVFAPYDAARGHSGAVPSTNGVALGSSLADAVARARRELVERDAIMRAWYLGAAFAALDAPPASSLAARSFESLDYEVRRFCLTRGHSGHTVFVLAVHRRGHYPATVAGAACREDLFGAIAAAELEAVQTLVAAVHTADAYRRWLKDGMPLDTLDGHMFAAASGLSSPSIAAFVARAGAAPIGPTPLDSGSWADVDVTPPPMRPWLRVARSMNSVAFPLVVGEHVGPAALLRSTRRVAGPHPFP